MGRRVLVTGADTLWGGRVVQALDGAAGIDLVIGLGARDPSMRFERAEYVHADQTYPSLHRIVGATRADTVVHASMVVDSMAANPAALHEVNVIGTMNLLAAAGAAGSPVTHVVVKSSSLVYGATERDPAAFGEETPRARRARTPVEQSLVEAEAMVRDFAGEHPRVPVALLRFANVLGAGITTALSRNLSRPWCPSIFGFDPLLEFVEERDVVRALEFATHRRLAGTYNVSGEGRLPWSEVASICGTHLVALPPWHPRLAAAPFARLGLVDLPPELEALLRFGRGTDTSRLRAAGFAPRLSSAGAVQAFARALRASPARRRGASGSYEHDVERFLRTSPAVVRRPGPRAHGRARPRDGLPRSRGPG